MEFAEIMGPVESDRFVIDSDAKADWALRKIREQREDAARWRAYYLAQIAKAEESAQQTEAFFMALLERYFATVPHRSTKTQDAYDLPSGKLLRKASSRIISATIPSSWPGPRRTPRSWWRSRKRSAGET